MGVVTPPFVRVVTPTPTPDPARSVRPATGRPTRRRDAVANRPPLSQKGTREWMGEREVLGPRVEEREGGGGCSALVTRS